MKLISKLKAWGLCVCVCVCVCHTVCSDRHPVLKYTYIIFAPLAHSYNYQNKIIFKNWLNYDYMLLNFE